MYVGNVLRKSDFMATRSRMRRTPKGDVFLRYEAKKTLDNSDFIVGKWNDIISTNRDINKRKIIGKIKIIDEGDVIW
jgi:hypothetical protein